MYKHKKKTIESAFKEGMVDGQQKEVLGGSVKLTHGVNAISPEGEIITVVYK